MPLRPKILVVDDEKEVGNFFRHLLKAQYEVTVVYSGEETAKALVKSSFDVAFVDLKLSDADGLTLLKMIKEKLPSCSVIIMTGYSTVSSAVYAIQNGAYNYIEKPFEDLQALRDMVEKALAGDRPLTCQDENTKDGFIVGTNPAMQRIVSMAEKVADKKITILIEGETGTGKEVLARFIHRKSKRKGHPFLAVNCGALSENLLASELFGHEKGSFTGAIAARRGIFELADQGTLFLDEIGEASLATQVKLLRVLEKPDEIYRIGGERPYKSDVRLIAATNVDLQNAVEEGSFRKDLYYRLNVINLCLPPLRERREDIPMLVDYLTKYQFNNREIAFSPEAMEILVNYQWRGNVRELFNVVAHALAFAEGKIIYPDNLPVNTLQVECPQTSLESLDKAASLIINSVEKYLACHNLQGGLDLPRLLTEIKIAENQIVKTVINKMLRYTEGNQGEAARMLGINNRRLQYYLNEK